MRVLITGGAGFVGRHFARHYANLGCHVHVVDNLVSGLMPTAWPFKPIDIYRITWKNSDCRIYFKTSKASDFDLIIHCAAIVGGRLKIEGDPLAVATDLSIDAEFFNWCVRGKPRKVVYFSSSAVYPVELQTRDKHCALCEALVNFNGTRVSLPDMTYGWAKLTGEYLAKFAAEKYGLNVVIYRPFSGYGEDQSFDYPFPSLIARVLAKENPIVIWGSGEQQRDFIHIDDIVAAVEATMDKLRPGEVMNLGSGQGVSFRELVTTACTLLKRSCQTVSDLDKPEGVFARVADSAYMRQFYAPKIGLPDGIARVAAHLKKQLTRPR